MTRPAVTLVAARGDHPTSIVPIVTRRPEGRVSTETYAEGAGAGGGAGRVESGASRGDAKVTFGIPAAREKQAAAATHPWVGNCRFLEVKSEVELPMPARLDVLEIGAACHIVAKHEVSREIRPEAESQAPLRIRE